MWFCDGLSKVRYMYWIAVCLYLVHIELAHTCTITLDWNKIWAWDLHHCEALIKPAKSLAPSNIKGRHGKVLYQKTRLLSMEHGVHLPIAKCNSTWTEYSMKNIHCSKYSGFFCIFVGCFWWVTAGRKKRKNKMDVFAAGWKERSNKLQD